MIEQHHVSKLVWSAAVQFWQKMIQQIANKYLCV